jgi:hypothetical protein
MCIENELHEIMNFYIDFFPPIKLGFFNVTKLTKILIPCVAFIFASHFFL